MPFPRNFRDTVRTIVRRLFRVYAHIYSNHFDQICALGIEGVYLCTERGCHGIQNCDVTAHLNTSYRHFFLFINEVCFHKILQWTQSILKNATQFDLVDKKELAPLDELNDAILAEDKTR